MTNYKKSLTSLAETVKGTLKKEKKRLSKKLPSVFTSSKGQAHKDLAPPRKPRKRIKIF